MSSEKLLWCTRYDLKTTFHKNPQLTTTYRQKAPIAQYVRFCAFLCNVFDLHHSQSSKRYFDRKYFNRRMRFCIRQAYVCRHFAASIYTHITLRQNGGTHKASLANKKRILRLKYLVKISPRALGMM